MSSVELEQKDQLTKLKAPNKFHVIMLNDDSTPMDFVVNILLQVFNHTIEAASDIMIEVHEKGRSIAGTYTYEVAEQKCMETITTSRTNGYPLDVIIEESE